MQPSRRRLSGLCAQLAPGAAAADEEAEIRRYMEEGKARALALDNRGPIRFGEDGNVAKEIVDSYRKYGFYVLEKVLSMEEVLEFRKEFEEMLENAPTTKGSPTDKHGRPVRFPRVYKFARACSDPVGGSQFGIYNFKGGETKPRHHIKMREPLPPPGAPEMVVENLYYPLAYMEQALYLYGNPKMLKVMEAVNGPDFTPFGEGFFYKAPFVGTSTAWHQDPSSAWDDEWVSPDFDVFSCGLNNHVSLYNCTPENALWVLPGSHVGGRKDQKALSAQGGGSDRLPGAVPVLCGPGDVYMQNRLLLHGAFPNSSNEPRVTMNFGFHRRASVLGKHTRGGYSKNADRSGKNLLVYDEAFVDGKCRKIQMAIDARRQKYPDEEPYDYAPYRNRADAGGWTGHHASPGASWNGLTREDMAHAALAEVVSI